MLISVPCRSNRIPQGAIRTIKHTPSVISIKFHSIYNTKYSTFFHTQFRAEIIRDLSLWSIKDVSNNELPIWTVCTINYVHMHVWYVHRHAYMNIQFHHFPMHKFQYYMHKMSFLHVCCIYTIAFNFTFRTSIISFLNL